MTTFCNGNAKWSANPDKNGVKKWRNYFQSAVAKKRQRVKSKNVWPVLN